MKNDLASVLARRTTAALVFAYLTLTIGSSDATADDTCRDWRVDRHPRLMADINNDGKADIVGFGDAGVWTAQANENGTFIPANLVLANFGFNQGWNPSKHVRLMADINHDGKADIVGFGDAGVWTALAKGDGGFLPEKFVLANFGVDEGWHPSKHVRLLADISNDGRADSFGVDQGWRPSKHVRLMADINYDNSADIVAFGDAGVWSALAKGDGSFLPEKFVLANFGVDQGWKPSKHERLMADISNDGRSDIIGFGDAGVWTALAKGDGGFFSEHLVLLEIFSCVGRLDFNLEWGEVDLGGFPVNPRWRWQRDNPGVPSASLCHFFSKTIVVNNALIKIPDC